MELRSIYMAVIKKNHLVLDTAEDRRWKESNESFRTMPERLVTEARELCEGLGVSACGLLCEVEKVAEGGVDFQASCSRYDKEPTDCPEKYMPAALLRDVKDSLS